MWYRQEGKEGRQEEFTQSSISQTGSFMQEAIIQLLPSKQAIIDCGWFHSITRHVGQVGCLFMCCYVWFYICAYDHGVFVDAPGSLSRIEGNVRRWRYCLVLDRTELI